MVVPLFNQYTWLEEGQTLHKPQTRIDLDFELQASDSVMLVNDT